MITVLAPAALATFAAIFWGVWWIPVRYLETLGLQGAWAGLVMNLGAFLLAATWVLLRGIRLRIDARAVAGAAFIGLAVTFYSTALNHTDVVRAVLLFYLAPVWSKILERVFLRMPWRWTSTMALAAALAGACLVLGGRVSIDSLNLGDLLSLASGMAWSAGAALTFAGRSTNTISLTTVTAFFAVLAAVPFAWASGLPDSGRELGLAMPVGIGTGVVYVLPIMMMTLWSARRLAPTTLTFLLTAEIVSGVASSAILLDEPFGAMQLSGAVLIVIAAMSEILFQRGRPAMETPDFPNPGRE
ncbi:MAG: DMT family transporter [Rhodobacter sp.]|nr:DMT family transporter [Rhodobacter sp.]